MAEREKGKGANIAEQGSRKLVHDVTAPKIRREQRLLYPVRDYSYHHRRREKKRTIKVSMK